MGHNFEVEHLTMPYRRTAKSVTEVNRSKLPTTTTTIRSGMIGHHTSMVDVLCRGSQICVVRVSERCDSCTPTNTQHSDSYMLSHKSDKKENGIRIVCNSSKVTCSIALY